MSGELIGAAVALAAWFFLLKALSELRKDIAQTIQMNAKILENQVNGLKAAIVSSRAYSVGTAENRHRALWKALLQKGCIVETREEHCRRIAIALDAEGVSSEIIANGRKYFIRAISDQIVFDVDWERGYSITAADSDVTLRGPKGRKDLADWRGFLNLKGLLWEIRHGSDDYLRSLEFFLESERKSESTSEKETKL